MAVGIVTTQANALLDAVFRSVAYTDPVAFFMKLHLGDPGSAGTANAAAHTTRVAVTFSAASGGAITNSAAVTFTSMAAAETITHWSGWDASTAGNFIFSDDFAVARLVAIGDTYEVAIGDLDINLAVLAA